MLCQKKVPLQLKGVESSHNFPEPLAGLLSEIQELFIISTCLSLGEGLTTVQPYVSCYKLSWVSLPAA